jgi:hypothetical protein
MVRVIIHRFSAESPPPLPGYHIIGILELVMKNLVNNLDPLFKKKWRKPSIKGYLSSRNQELVDCNAFSLQRSYNTSAMMQMDLSSSQASCHKRVFSPFFVSIFLPLR